MKNSNAKNFTNETKDKWSEYFRLLAPNGLLLLGTALLCAAFTAFSALESENDEAAYQKLLDTQGKELEKIIEEDERLAKDIANLQDNYKSTVMPAPKNNKLNLIGF